MQRRQATQAVFPGPMNRQPHDTSLRMDDTARTDGDFNKSLVANADQTPTKRPIQPLGRRLANLCIPSRLTLLLFADYLAT